MLWSGWSRLQLAALGALLCVVLPLLAVQFLALEAGVVRRPAELEHEREEAARTAEEHPKPSPEPAPTGPRRPRVLYGIQTSGKKRYEANLAAQLATWARDVAPGRVFAVGPGARAASPRWEPSGCPVNLRLCKAAFILERAFNLSRSTVDFDWLILVFEDHYFDVPRFERLLARNVPAPRAEAVVLSGHGCGQAWRFAPASRNGTLPKPAGWVENPADRTCPYVQRHGAMCGGHGMYLSRAAVDAVFGAGVGAARRYIETHLHPDWQVDMSLSCLLANRSVPVRPPRAMTLVTMRGSDYAAPPKRNGVVYHLVCPNPTCEAVPKYFRRIREAKQRDRASTGAVEVQR